MSPKRMPAGRLLFFVAIFAVLAFGIYVLMTWGFHYGWIGIAFVVSGLSIFVAFFDTIAKPREER